MAIESLHQIYVCQLTPEEKKREEWLDHHMGFSGTWQDGWVMYDGTFVVLHATSVN